FMCFILVHNVCPLEFVEDCRCVLCPLVKTSQRSNRGHMELAADAQMMMEDSTRMTTSPGPTFLSRTNAGWRPCYGRCSLWFGCGVFQPVRRYQSSFFLESCRNV